MWNGSYNQNQLPSELFHNVGTTTYEGTTYRVVNNGDGTRTVTPTSSGGGGGTSGGSNIPAFNFNWEATRKAEYDRLTPYYEQKLIDAKGDIELAKKFIDDDYNKGVRVREEDFNVTQRKSDEDFISSLAEAGRKTQEETFDTQGGLNKRGVLFGEAPQGTAGQNPMQTSQYANQFFLQPLDERQKARKLAIERALQRDMEVAGLTRSRGDEGAALTKDYQTSQQVSKFRDVQDTLKQEQENKAYNINAPSQYNIAYTKYKAAAGIPG